MGRLIEKIIRDAPTERRKIHVPEWQGEELPDGDVYFKPLTKAAIEAAMPKDDENMNRGMAGLYLLVHTAEDANGKKLFERRDIDGLREKANLGVLTRVEAFMWATQVPEIKQAEEDLKQDPTSASA